MKNFKSAIAVAMGVFTLSPCHSTENTYGPEFGDFAGLECLPSNQLSINDQTNFHNNDESYFYHQCENNPKYIESKRDLETGQFLLAIHSLTNANRVDENLELAYVYLLSATNYPYNSEARAELNAFKKEMAYRFPNHTFSHIL